MPNINMKMSYNKLWKLLIDLNMTKKELIELTGISKATIYKLNHGENINTDILLRICESLKCKLNDIVEIINVEESNE